MTYAYPCVCCGFRTMAGPPGSYELCPLCGWQDDLQQLRWPALPRGANKPSLIDAQRERGTDGGDPADFDREPGWHPIEAGRDRFEPTSRMLAPWPDDYTILYWWRRRPGTTWWTESVPALLGEAGEPDGTAFADAVRAAAASVPPADPDNLAGMWHDFDFYLLQCPSIREVTVTGAADPARQLTARCLAHPWAAPAVVAAELRKTWLDDLRYRHWESHLLRHTPVSVRLDVVTKPSDTDYYITGLIVAVWS